MALAAVLVIIAVITPVVVLVPSKADKLRRDVLEALEEMPVIDGWVIT